MSGRIHAFVIRLNPQEEERLRSRHKAADTTLPISTWARQLLLEPSPGTKAIRALAAMGLVDKDNDTIRRMMEG